MAMNRDENWKEIHILSDPRNEYPNNLGISI